MYPHQHSAPTPAQVCANPINVDLTVSDSKLGFSWSKSLSTSDSFYVPGLSIDAPGLGAAGVQVGFSLGGAKHELDLSMTLDACATIGEEAESPSVRGGDVQVGDYTKCFPNPPITVVEFSGLDFSWVTCGNGNDDAYPQHDDGHHSGGGGTTTW